ncbi:ABC transporter permease [Pseudoalteromonas luteoviolacea]|uniref:ABC transporter permease n=1 Tax=Pseudoalteromonas luteoviolacea TaxID=43657 RepID=A0A1C0TNN8_9GAMM|nr:iron ABC transporter permease [Pseudoalteromonas luteoviolacea]MBQ4813593.1 iron ABC transporter permease [Pseudoalteromonas luteoviolacea]OCQ20547.1 ABC transporter permease [Pseudoalteromonas luteoviolacea]
MRVVASSLLVLACLFSFISALSIGAIQVDFYDVWLALWSYDNTQLAQKIIIELRLPRTVLAFLAGAGLATAGLILQTVTRNPLADPYLFGISSGASFGVVLLLTLFGIQNGLAMSGAALLGSVCAMSLLLLIAYHKGTAQIENMLLAGVALSFLFNAFTSLLLYWSDPQAIAAIIFWSLGSFSRADWAWMWLPSFVVALGLLTVICFRRHLNALLLGDESAVTLGVNVHRLRLGMLLVSSLLTAVLVAACGGVGFVGLMIPHIVRFFISQARVLGMVVTALSGGLLMLWVDVLARSLIDNQELPIGVITAAIGSVFFLSLLMFKKRSASI